MIDQKIQKAIEDLRTADASLADLEQTVQAKRSYLAQALMGFDKMEAPLELTAEMEPSTTALAHKITNLGKGNAAQPAQQPARKAK